MILFLLAAIGCGALVAFGVQSYRHDWAVLCGVLGAIVFSSMFVVALTARLGFPAYMERAAQTRTTAARLGCTASEDVLGTALAFNRDIAGAKVWLTRWYARPFFAPGMDTVTLIAIPECR